MQMSASMTSAPRAPNGKSKAIRTRCAARRANGLRFILHQNFVGREPGNGGELAFGDLLPEGGDSAEVAVGGSVTADLAGQVLADDVGCGADDFVVLLGGVEAGGEDDDELLHARGKLAHPALA